MLASIVLPRPTSSARMARPPICRSTRWATSIWWGSSLIALASRVINRSKPGTRAIRSASRRRSYQARSAGAPRSCSAKILSERSSTDQTSAAGAGGGGRGDGASGGSGMVGQRVAGGRNIQPERCLYKPSDALPLPALHPAIRDQLAQPSAAPPKLPGVLHDQRSGLGAMPLEEAVGFLAVVEDDEQSGAGGAEPAEPRVRGPHACLIAVLHECLEQHAGREEIGDADRGQRAGEVPLLQAHVVVLDEE